MRILGVSEGPYPKGKTYICEISVSELRKVMDKAGYRDGDELEKLKAGTDFPIDEGFDFRSAILAASLQMKEGYDAFVKAVPVMTQFASLVAGAEAKKESAE